MTARIAVVVLNWNNADDTLACLRSLAASDAVTSYAVDNGSTDGSDRAIERSGHADVLVRTGANLGYAGGNNVGVRRALADGFDWVVVLNNDTVVPAGTFERLVGHLQPEPTRVAASPVIARHDDPAETWFRGGVLDRGWPRHVQPGEPANTGALTSSAVLTGCCIAAHRAVWERVGPFDDGFFLIFEDSDWSVRARRLGVRLVVANDCVITHRVSRSFRDGPMPHLATYYFVRNGLRFDFRYARRYLPRFVAMWVLRPGLRGARAHDARRSVFPLLGLLGALVHDRGPAPRWVQQLAAPPLHTTPVEVGAA